jgi:AraC-like DNA-binding protein
MSGKLSKVDNWETLARGAGYRPSMMAALCAVSLRQLERFFVDRFGASPGKWTRDLRIQAARNRISAGLSNKEVVDELRFANPSHLCHEFKRAFGVSPQSFATTPRIPDTTLAAINYPNGTGETLGIGT